MRRPSPFVLALIGAGLALPAAAQDGARTLSWQGHPAMAMDAASGPETSATARRANRPIPHGGHAMPETPARGLTPAPGPRSVGLTPANAWLRNRAPVAAPAEVMAEEVAPAAEIAPPPPAPVTRPAPPPAPVVRAAPPPAPAPAPAPVDYLPEQGGEGQPTPASVAYPAPAVEAAPAPVADPYAPRRDAPIFRLQRPAAAPAPEPQTAPAEAPAEDAEDAPRPRRVATVTPNTADRPPSQGARYYSLHRQSGRTPDAVALPAPTYIDALAVNLAETPASQDLAEPAPAPTLIRDATGRMRVAPAASDGDHQ